LCRAEALDEVEHVQGRQPPAVVALEGQLALVDDTAKGPVVDGTVSHWVVRFLFQTPIMVGTILDNWDE
jgi:hypothetical protein